METAGKKKILYCITKSNWGGAQKYVYDLATNLSRDKYEIAVVLGGNGKLKEKLETAGIRTISVKSLERDIGIKKDISSFFELLKIFGTEKPDIIHLNSSKMGGIGGLAGRIARIKKIIFTAHGWAYNEERSFLQKFAITILHFITVALSHMAIAVSEKAKEQFKSCGLLKKKLTVIHNGIGEIDFMDREKAREELTIKFLPQNDKVKEKINKNPIWIGTISELHKNKGLVYAIQAIANIIKDSDEIYKFKNMIFIIIGEGEERKNLEELIKENRLEDFVFLVGNLEEGSSYLKAFDIFTLTSITEALPYVVLEAGKAEVPIIASNVGGISEIVDDMKSGVLIQPRKSREIKDAIEYLINHPDKKEVLASLLKEKIDRDFSINKMIPETVKIYMY